MLLPSTSLTLMGEIAGVNTASLGGCLHSLKKRVRWAEGLHDKLNSHVFDLERDGTHQLVLCPWLIMRWKQPTWLWNHLWCPNDPRGYGIDDDDDDYYVFIKLFVNKEKLHHFRPMQFSVWCWSKCTILSLDLLKTYTSFLHRDRKLSR